MKTDFNDFDDFKTDIKKKKTVEINKSLGEENEVSFIKGEENEVSFIKGEEIIISKSTESNNGNKMKQYFEKYKFPDNKNNKGMEMLYKSFEANIDIDDAEKAVCISRNIIEVILKNHSNDFPKIVRSKSHNLKENRKLCINVYESVISPQEFVSMSHHDMQNDDIKLKDEKSIKNSILDSQIAKPLADTEIFQCGKCKERKCTYYQLQTRSCDEPMTTFVTCTLCGNKWKF